MYWPLMLEVAVGRNAPKDSRKAQSAADWSFSVRRKVGLLFFARRMASPKESVP